MREHDVKLSPYRYRQDDLRSFHINNININIQSKPFDMIRD